MIEHIQYLNHYAVVLSQVIQQLRVGQKLASPSPVDQPSSSPVRKITDISIITHM